MILTKFKKKDYYHLADKGMIIWYEEIRELWIIDVSEKKNDFFLSTRGFKQANVILFRFTRDIIPPVPLLINVTTINAHILSLSLFLPRMMQIFEARLYLFLYYLFSSFLRSKLPRIRPFSILTFPSYFETFNKTGQS